MCNTCFTVCASRHAGCGHSCGYSLWDLLFGNGCSQSNYNTQRVCRDACGNLRIINCGYNTTNTNNTSCGYNAANTSSANGNTSYGCGCFGSCASNTNTTTTTGNGYYPCGCCRRRSCYNYDV